MKKIVLGMLLVGIYGFAQAGETQKPLKVDGIAVDANYDADTITLDHLVGMDKKQFKGKTLAEFLKSPEAKGHQEISYRLHEDGSLQALKVKYTDKLYLNIYLREFNFVKPQSVDQKPDLEKLKNEIIDEMRVVYVLQQ